MAAEYVNTTRNATVQEETYGTPRGNLEIVYTNMLQQQQNQQSWALTSTALSRTTWDTVSRSWAAIPGLLRPRVNRRSAIVCNVSLIKKTKKIITKNATMPNKTIQSSRMCGPWCPSINALQLACSNAMHAHIQQQQNRVKWPEPTESDGTEC